MLGDSPLGDVALGDGPASVRRVTGISGGTLTATGVSGSLRSVRGESGGTAAATGVSGALWRVRGEGGATATATGVSGALWRVRGESGATATATGEQGTETLTGSSGATATATGESRTLHLVRGISGGTCTATGHSSALRSVRGESGGTATATGEGGALAVTRGVSGGLLTASGQGYRMRLSSGSSGATATAAGESAVQDDTKTLIIDGPILLEWDIWAVYLSWQAEEDIMTPLILTQGSAAVRRLTLYAASRTTGLSPLPLDGCSGFGGLIQQVDPDTGQPAGAPVALGVSRGTQPGQVLVDFRDSGLTPGTWQLQVMFTDGSGRADRYGPALITVTPALERISP